MRLSKRIAAVALAAVMAVSMLTACGGGGGGSNGGSSSSGSNNGSSSSSSSSGSASSGSSSGSSSSSSSGSGSSSSGTTTDEGTTTLSNSRTGIIVNNVLKNRQVCIVLVNDEYDKENKTYPQETLALSGKSMYQKRANESGNIVFSELIGDGKTNKGYYVVYPESAEYKSKKKERTDNGYNTEKMTVPYYYEYPYVPGQEDASLSNFDLNQKVELGTYTYKKNGPVYHSETVTDNVTGKYGHKSIYCYDNSGSLKLLVERTVEKETGTVVDESIAIVKSITYSVNPSLFKLNPNAKTLDELIEAPTN